MVDILTLQLLNAAWRKLSVLCVYPANYGGLISYVMNVLIGCKDKEGSIFKLSAIDN